MLIDPVELAQKLIRFKTITPQDEGVSDFLMDLLSSYGFVGKKLVFRDVSNLYARLGNRGPNLCFAGHTDVVPVGGSWSIDPFSAIIKNNLLFGRGAVDMKAAIAAFISAAIDFISNHKKFNGSISFLITGDEEGLAINGTKKVLEYLKSIDEKIDACIVGEPTSIDMLGDTIKHGRRGSINFNLIVKGKQGHVAYPHLAENPIYKLIEILDKLKKLELDQGNEDFPPSNLEITNIATNNKSTNVIPDQAEAFFNIRFNNINSSDKIIKRLEKLCAGHELLYDISAEAFLGNKNSLVVESLCKAIKNVKNIDTQMSTSGGTSDARFIKDFSSVVEFGLLNKMAHKIDECVDVNDIIDLQKIYLNFLYQFFKI